MKRMKWEDATEKDGLMTKERVRVIQKEKGTCALPAAFIRKFDEEWTAAVGILRGKTTKT